MFQCKRVWASAVLCAGVSGMSGAASAAAPLFVISDLTPTGYSSSTAYDINASGDAVGIAGRVVGGSLESAYFFYDHSAGTSTAFGASTLLFPGELPRINDSGLIAGTGRFIGGSPQQRGFIYNGSTFTDLGTLYLGPGTGSNIRPDSEARDINNAGLAVGNATSGVATNDNRDIFTGTASPISDIDGDLTVVTRGDLSWAINNAGLIAGSNESRKATRFGGVGSETLLLAGTGYAGENSEAVDLNEVGQVAVNATTSNDVLLYDSSGGSPTVTLIPQIGTGNRMSASAINESGDVVGHGDRNPGLSGQARGYVYDASTGTSIILEDRVVDKTIPAVSGLGDWGELRTAHGINDDGWIVGVGNRRFDGASFPTNRAYLLIPTLFGTGDYNASGQVEQGDLDLVLQNWGDDTSITGTPAGWVNDLPGGQIEQTELDKVLQNWGSTSAPDFTRSPVPEPAAAALLGFASLALRRRQNSITQAVG